MSVFFTFRSPLPSKTLLIIRTVKKMFQLTAFALPIISLKTLLPHYFSYTQYFSARAVYANKLTSFSRKNCLVLFVKDLML